MRYIFFFLFLTESISFANDYQKITVELSSLQQSYTQYISQLRDITLTNTKKLDQKFLRQKPNATNFLFSPSNNFTFLPLDIFNDNMYQLNTMTSAEKQFIAELDNAKLNTTLFMLTNLNTFYKMLSKNKSSSNNAYKNLFKKGEQKLLSLAQRAYTAPTEQAEILNTEYNLIIQQFSMIPFPPKYSFYRRRMAYSIATPRAAQDQINRLTNSLAAE